MSRWRPSPAEERWLEMASELGAALPPGALAERNGGWRSTGPLARIALFVLGFLAGALLLGILGLDDELTWLAAGLIATIAAELLTVRRRLFASGFEEGLGLAGYLLIGAWITTIIRPIPDFLGSNSSTLVLIVAAGAAGLRRLNAFVTTCAVIAYVYWLGWTTTAFEFDEAVGGGVSMIMVGCVLAVFALALGARNYRRPSHDRMLDWLVAVLPIATYTPHAAWGEYMVAETPDGIGTGRILVLVTLLAVAIVLLIAGLRRRRHAPLLGFLGCVACLAVELRLATGLATETWLVLCGLVALGAGAGLDRYLRRPRKGLTSAALTDREDPLDLLQTAGAAVLAQRAAPEPPAPDRGFSGSGGRFGGGGAGGSY